MLQVALAVIYVIKALLKDNNRFIGVLRKIYFFVMSIILRHSTPYIVVVLPTRNKGCRKLLQPLQNLLFATVPPLPKRIPIQIMAVLINSRAFIEYSRTGVVLASGNLFKRTVHSY